MRSNSSILGQGIARGRSRQIANRLGYCDLLILYKLGYLPFSASGCELLFHLLSKLHERTSRHHHELSASAVGQRVSATPR
ncbi:ATP-binding protein [Rhizobium phaseoli]|uniref:ATP-binding protein n=1 Tax=Rhizobium phaseoli TaxID=396 RepID=UPI003CCA4F3D